MQAGVRLGRTAPCRSISGSGERTHRTAGRVADGALISGMPEDLPASIENIHKGEQEAVRLARAGSPGGGASVMPRKLRRHRSPSSASDGDWSRARVGAGSRDMASVRQVHRRLAHQHSRRHRPPRAPVRASSPGCSNEHMGRFVRETLAAEGVDARMSQPTRSAYRSRHPRHRGRRDLPADLLSRELRRHGALRGGYRRQLHRLGRRFSSPGRIFRAAIARASNVPWPLPAPRTRASASTSTIARCCGARRPRPRRGTASSPRPR